MRRARQLLPLAALLLTSACGGPGHASPSPSASKSPSPADASGRWQTTLAAPDGAQTLLIDLVRAPDGVWHATMDAPDEWVLGRPVEGLNVGPRGFGFQLGTNAGLMTFDGTYSGDRWDGTMTMRDQPAPAQLVRIGPVPEKPYSEEPFDFHSGALALHGTLILPQGVERAPAVVLLHGATTPNRDDFRFHADRFARAGVAALIYDKRDGGPESAGMARYGLDELAGDARAALAALRAHAHIDPARLGLWGASQGGWVAPLAAAEEPELAFVAVVSAPCVSYAEVDSYQLLRFAASRGVPAPERNEALDLLTAIQELARSKAAATPALEQRLARMQTHPWARAASVFTRLPTPEDVRDQIRWRALDFEPAKAWKRVRAPVLALYGSNDEQIPVEISVQRMRVALSGNANAQVKVLPGANHELQGNKEYPAVLFDWVVERVRR